MRELLTNTLDQARAVAEMFKLPGEITLAEVDNALMIHINGDLLAEIKWRRGFRKYVQSHYDAGKNKSRAEDDEVEKGADTMCMELINYSSYLPWESFYFGVTSKANSKNMIGTHGEGLSAACTVLLRHGCNISVTTSAYKTRIVQLQKYACFQVKRQRELEDQEERDDTVHFTIVFKPPSESINVKAILASIRLATSIKRYAGTRGELLTTEPYCGKQYNRGIFVSECLKGKCLFGYNFYDPDKTLLQSRDRNSHNTDSCLRECGSILSEAIIADPEVCKKVLASLIIKGALGGDGVSQLPVYEDLQDGAFLTAEAKEALRLANEESAKDNRKMIFCANSTREIEQLADAQDMTVVFSHRMLHNYRPVKDNFYTSLVRSTSLLPDGSVLATHQAHVMKLLKCQGMFRSNLQLPQQLLGFWKVKGVVYVTGLDNFEKALRDEGLCEEQEINMHKTLDACGLGLRETIQIVRLFHEAAGSRHARTEGTSEVSEELRQRLRLELRREVQAEVDEKQERQRVAKEALDARRRAAQREREEAQQVLAEQQREAARVAEAALEAERVEAAHRAQERAVQNQKRQLERAVREAVEAERAQAAERAESASRALQEAQAAQKQQVERAVAEAVKTERAEAERRVAQATQDNRQREADAARTVQATREAEEQQRRDRAQAQRLAKLEVQQRLVEMERQQEQHLTQMERRQLQRLAELEQQEQAQIAAALEAKDAQYRAQLAAQEAQYQAALEALQAEHRAVLRAEKARLREAQREAEPVREQREVHCALMTEGPTVGTVVEREEPDFLLTQFTAGTAVTQASDVSSVGGDSQRTADDSSDDDWGSLGDDSAEFSDEISSASEGPDDVAEADTSREVLSSDDIVDTASDAGSRASTPSDVVPARSQQQRLQEGRAEVSSQLEKTQLQAPVRQCIQLRPARGDVPALEITYHATTSGVLLYSNCGTTKQLSDRLDEFLSLPGMRTVVHWLLKHFTVIAFQASLPAGCHREPDTVFRGEGWDLMLNFSGASWDAEMMRCALRLRLSGISVADIVMSDRF
jgi:hypothetical protein